MTKEQILQKITDELSALNESVAALKQVLENSDGSRTEAPAKPEKPKITLEQVRGILADKSRCGYTAEVRALITGYGAERLSGIDPANYEELLRKAEGIGR